ncbi:MAG TPA: hypothetical protein VLT36_12985 [Candidatus Dormibacteraeota bacterium]|nr:hypothetical protein [Candidatus Dormibacteraeota bacterium]
MKSPVEVFELDGVIEFKDAEANASSTVVPFLRLHITAAAPMTSDR